MIVELLKRIEKATGIRPTAFSTDKINTLPSINYEFFRVADDGAKAHFRLTLRITADSLKEAYAAENKLLSSIITVGDETICGATTIEQNGGGTLQVEGLKAPQLISYFDIITKARS